MPAKTTKPPTKAKEAAEDKLVESLKQYIRTKGDEYLKDPNISSMGIGYKQTAGKKTKELALQFTVNKKAAPELLEALSTAKIPEVILVDGKEIPTDVIQRRYEASYKTVRATEQVASQRKVRVNPLTPGVSIAIDNGTAGTAGCIVFDRLSGSPYVLSNWHVLHGAGGNIAIRWCNRAPTTTTA